MTDVPASEPLLLGLTGRAGSGKTTAATYLADEHGFVAIALADPIRDMIATLAAHVDVDDDWLHDTRLKEQPMPVLHASYRRLATALGDALRAVDDNVFVRLAAYRADQAVWGGDNVLISDVRYPHEAAWLARRGGTLVRIDDGRGAAGAGAHSSEQHTHALPADDTVYNTGSLGTLHDQLDAVVQRLRGGQYRTDAPGGAA